MRIFARSPLLGSTACASFLVTCGGQPVPVPAAAPESIASFDPPAPGSALTGVRSSQVEPHAGPGPVVSTHPPVDDSDDDPEEANDPATLKPVLAKGGHPSFSKGTVSERECWRTVSLSGEARRDYASLIEHCGKPTGSLEYAKPAVGRLDHLRDKRDTFIVFLRAGLCYRFFGVGDATIPNLDILIERNGALQGEDRTHGPVAIINTDQAWCIESDAEYRFLVQIGGEGRGRYVFGVWARPQT